MIVVYVMVVIAGILVDIIDFVIRFAKFLMRKKVPSAGMFLGLFLQVVGLSGLKTQELRTGQRVLTWKLFIIFLLLALGLHLFIHIVLQYVLLIPINIYHGRKLFDMSTLPNRKGKQHSET
ncbi:hypothetical protein KA005_83910 [bacterium]|nr:hypothetical protein [bacterium]